MIRDLAAVTIAAILATGFSLEMNRLQPVENGIAPQKLLLSRHYTKQQSVKRTVGRPVNHKVNPKIMPSGLEPEKRHEQANVIALSATNLPPISASLETCSHQIILSCFARRSAARKRLIRLGGSFVGGGAGMEVINTKNIPEFRNGYYCVADGPYPTRKRARNIVLDNSVRKIYIRKECQGAHSPVAKNSTGNLLGIALYQSQ